MTIELFIEKWACEYADPWPPVLEAEMRVDLAAVYGQGIEEGRKTMREEILRGLRSEDDSVQLQAIIASVEAIPLKKEPT